MQTKDVNVNDKKLSLEIAKEINTVKKKSKTLKHRFHLRDLSLEGFNYLAEGLSRVCFIHESGKYVLKIEKEWSMSSNGHKQNETEVKNYKEIPKRLKKYFLEPLSFAEDFKWILMLKVETHKDLSHEETWKLYKKLKKIFYEKKVYLRDLHDENVGKFNNKPVVIDYGFNLSFGERK